LAILAATVTLGHAQIRDMMRTAPDARPSGSVPKTTLKGFLVDKTCAYRDGSVAGFGPAHTTKCTLGSAAGGIGVVQNGVFYPFDEKGAKKALELLKKTKMTKGVMVTVTGNMEARAFAVSSLKELKKDDDDD
jgi:hypothetical protein